MSSRATFLGLIIAGLVLSGCGGGGGHKLVSGFIEGQGVIDGGGSVTFSVEASGDTGITYLWSVAPPSAGTFSDPTSATTVFSPTPVSSDTTVAIQVVVNSDHSDPLVHSRDVVIKASPAGSGLSVGEIVGLTVLNEYSSGAYSVTADGDEGITYQWSCVPPEAGIFDPPDSAETTFAAAGVAEDTQAEIRVEVNSDSYGPEVRTLDITIIDVSVGPNLEVGEIDGALVVYERASETYSVTAGGDTGITYEWTCDPPDSGVFDSPTSAATGFAAAEVTEDTQVEIRVEVNSDHFGPVVRTLDISVLDAELVVGQITGPVALNEYEPGTYSVQASGDTGLSYEWSCDPPNSGIFGSPASADTSFTPADVAQDTAVEIRVVVNSDHAGPIVRTLDIVVHALQLLVSEIDGPILVGENSSEIYSVQASGDTGISFQWTCDPPDAGVFDSPESSDTGFLPEWVGEDTEVEIRVEVVSDYNGPVQRTLGVTVLNTHADGWSRVWGGSDSDEGYGLTVDDLGNVFVTGCFQDVVDFDPGDGTEERTSAGGGDAFLAKFDSSGEVLWALTWGGTGEDIGYGVALDSMANIYVTGWFEGVVDFDPGDGVEAHSGGTGFLSKFDSSGEHQWARTWSSECMGVAVDGLDNIFVTGGFEGTVDFFPGMGSDEHTSTGGKDVFLCKYSPVGGFQWALTWGGISLDRGEGVAADGSGGIYVTGGFSGADVDFDPGAEVDQHSSNGAHDAFLSKFDTDGAFQWARTWGGDGGTWCLDWGRGVAASGFGEIYVTGVFYETADFDPGPGSTLYAANGEGDVFLCKYDSAGDFQWVRTWGGMNDSALNPDHGWDVAVDGYGNAYVTGCFQLTADFDITPLAEEHTSNGESDVFLSKFDSNGDFQWAYTWGGVEPDEGHGVAVDSWGNSFVTGFFSDIVDFDPGEDVQERISNGGRDVFLRMVPPGWGVALGNL